MVLLCTSSSVFYNSRRQNCGKGAFLKAGWLVQASTQKRGGWDKGRRVQGKGQEQKCFAVAQMDSHLWEPAVKQTHHSSLKSMVWYGFLKFSSNLLTFYRSNCLQMSQETIWKLLVKCILIGNILILFWKQFKIETQITRSPEMYEGVWADTR